MLDLTCKEIKALCAFIYLYKCRLTKECYERDLASVHNKLITYDLTCDMQEKQLRESARLKTIIHYCKYCSSELQRGVHGFCGNNCLELFEASKNIKPAKKKSENNF